MLDPNGRREVLEAVSELNQKENVTVILITHYMEEAVLADKIVVLDKGKKALEGDSREVFSQVEKMKSLGLTVPQVTEVAYGLSQKGIKFDRLPLTVEEFLESL